MVEALRRVQPMGQSERSPLRGFRERGGAPCHAVDGWPIVCTCSWVVPDSWGIQARFHPFVNVCPSSRDAASVAPDGLGVSDRPSLGREDCRLAGRLSEGYLPFLSQLLGW